MADTLPSNESALFRTLVKHYESKQYKKGIRSADQILKKFPEHAETLAMKGLCLSGLGQKEESFSFARQGLRKNLRSQICWHVFGLLHRANRDYEEAVKCYRNALKQEGDNHRIQRDMAQLQIQIRDLKGFNESRRLLLVEKPNQQVNWVAYAISSHLIGEHARAIEIIDSYIKNIADGAENDPYEMSEMQLYKNQILEEKGDFDAALAHLDEIRESVKDKLAWKEKRANFLLQLHQYRESEQAFRELLLYNPDNFEYHRGLQCCLLQSTEHISLKSCELPCHKSELTQEQKASLIGAYQTFKEEKPRCTTFQRILLDILTGEQFKQELTDFLIKYLRKGIPTLFAIIKPIYRFQSQDKVDIIARVVEEFIESLRNENKFPGNTEEENPMTLLWALFFQAQHYDLLNDWAKALERIDECIDHTPTILDLYQKKARILKHSGDLIAASEVAEEGRFLDLADRYINSKSTLYLLRIDKTKQAENTIGLFTRDGLSGNVDSNLHDLQCQWYQLECAQSFIRSKKYDKALKKLKGIEKNYEDFIEDQFDFHSYCLRKMTIRSYVRLLRFEDNIMTQKNYNKAMETMAKCYLQVVDDPAEEKKDEENYEGLSAEEKRKAKQKAKREAKKKKKEEEEKTDPELEELLKGDMVEEASKCIKKITGPTGRLEAHIIAADIFTRKQKWLLVLKAVKRARELDATHPDTHRITIKFLKNLDDVKSNLVSIVAETIDSTLTDIFGKIPVVEELELQYRQSALSLAQKLAAAEMLYFVHQNKEEAVSIASDLSNSTNINIQDCVNTLRALETIFQDSATAQSFSLACNRLFPFARAFGGSAPLNRREVPENDA